MQRRTRAWIGFGTGAALACAALSLLTLRVHQAAEDRARAAAEAQHQEDVRTALYRMEQRFAPLLARALGRTEVAGAIPALLHLRLDLEDGRAEPLEGEARLPVELERRARELFDETSSPLMCVTLPNWVETSGELGSNLSQLQARGQQRTDYEWAVRQNAVNVLNNDGGRWVAPLPGAPPVMTGRLAVGWDESGPEPRLLFARGISADGRVALQVLGVEWAPLQDLLAAEIADLFPEARLTPLFGDDAQQPEDLTNAGARLASFPAALEVNRVLRSVGDEGALWATIGATWALALGAALAATLAFRASQRDAARQRRFTSAVTHELRTPLTTFQMYSEMLARDMVPDERRPEYLRALEEESRRLGALVENVLAHARLEDGRARARRERMRVDALLDRCRPPLERRCTDAGTRLALDPGNAADATLETDPEAVSLILFNLVDNAAKYGAPSLDGNGTVAHDPAAPIELTLERQHDTLSLTVRDPGPGIAPDAAARIFEPFERAGRDESDAAPGVGLGLALARDLARALGGDLVLTGTSTEGGACFDVRLPLSA